MVGHDFWRSCKLLVNSPPMKLFCLNPCLGWVNNQESSRIYIDWCNSKGMRVAESQGIHRESQPPSLLLSQVRQEAAVTSVPRLLLSSVVGCTAQSRPFLRALMAGCSLIATTIGLDIVLVHLCPATKETCVPLPPAFQIQLHSAVEKTGACTTHVV